MLKSVFKRGASIVTTTSSASLLRTSVTRIVLRSASQQHSLASVSSIALSQRLDPPPPQQQHSHGHQQRQGISTTRMLRYAVDSDSTEDDTDNVLIFEATEENFAKLVKDSPVPVLLDCYATWCAPCKALTPTIEAVVTSMNGKVRLVKADVDKLPHELEEFGVEVLPTVIGIDKGEVKGEFRGLVPKAKIEQFIRDTFDELQATLQ